MLTCIPGAIGLMTVNAAMVWAGYSSWPGIDTVLSAKWQIVYFSLFTVVIGVLCFNAGVRFLGPLNTMLMLNLIPIMVFGIRGQLHNTPGLIGYSLQSHIAAKRFWTLSVWDNEVALTNFVHKNPHNEAMMTLHRFMGGTQFVRWTVKGSAVPPTWADAMARSEAEALGD